MGGKIALWLGNLLPVIVYRVALLLGVSVITFVGLDSLIAIGYGLIADATQNVPASIMNIIALSGADKYITIVISAHVAGYSAKKFQKAIGIR